MISNKRGIAINTIIGMVMALLVLAILAAVLTGQFTKFSQAERTCTGSCLEPCTYSGDLPPGARGISSVRDCDVEIDYDTLSCGLGRAQKTERIYWLHQGTPPISDIDEEEYIYCSVCCS